MRASHFFLTSLFLLLPFSVAAQSGDFDLALRSKVVGSASFRIEPEAGGLRSESMVRLSAKGMEYAFSKSERLSSAYALRHVELNAVVNREAVHLTATPNGNELALKISASGRTSASRLDLHPASVFLTDFDPGALTILLKLASGGSAGQLWAILPKQTGSVEPVKLATYPDEQGTLDGKPLVVHHRVASFASLTTDLFTGAQDELLQAELPQQGFVLVRKGFVLTPPTKPQVPPATGAEATPQQPAAQPQS